MERILLIGNAGAGKTTFARKLAAKCNLPLVHLDQLYWCGEWEHLTREQFDALLQVELEKPQWIIDGNFNRTIPHRLQYCDTVFFLDLPTEVCLESIRARIGKPRSDMPWVETEEDTEFMEYIRAFSTEQRPGILSLLQKYSNVNVVTFHSREEVDAYLGKQNL